MMAFTLQFFRTELERMQSENNENIPDNKDNDDGALNVNGRESAKPNVRSS